MTKKTQILLGLLAGSIVGGLFGYQFGEEEDDKRENALIGVLLGALAGLGIAAIASSDNDSRNYRLYKNGRLVYHGVTGKDRVTTRMNEHGRSGKVFDSFDFDSPRTRKSALKVEKQRIIADRPKYNKEYR